MSDVSFSFWQGPRVRVRRFRDDDLAPFVAYRSDREVARYQSWHEYSEAEGRAFIAEMKVRHPGQMHAWFQFAVEVAGMGLIGDVAVRFEQPVAELGFTFARQHHGHGFATEAVSVVLHHLGGLGIERAIAITDARNAPAIALLERAGFTFEGRDIDVHFKGERCDELRFGRAIALDVRRSAPRPQEPESPC
jgi:aminoglycoside 6'-N-acetyltransferase